MKRSRKETAWKKSRTFGDIKGGRLRPKLADNIFNRQHNLLIPDKNDETPIYIVDNPSRDYFFPITVDDIEYTISKLPAFHTEKITHIWLKKNSPKENYQGCFITGSGVNLIVLYAFPVDLKMRFGIKKPSQKILRWYSAFHPNLVLENEEWALQWSKESIKQYYLEGLLLHEIGHQIDSRHKRFMSKKYQNRKAEKYADNFAYYWADQIRNEIE